MLSGVRPSSFPVIVRASTAHRAQFHREPGSSSRSAADRLVDTAGMLPSQVVQIGSREGVIAAVAEGVGLGIIFDGELPLEPRVVKVPISGQVIRSHDEIVCMRERRTSQVISEFLAIAQEYIDERRSLIAARQKSLGR